MMIVAFLLCVAEPSAGNGVDVKPIVVQPASVVWKDAPPSMPKGAQLALLEGDPTKPGIVTMRLKVPKGFGLAKHTHPTNERVTVLNGTWEVTYEGQKPIAFPAGSFYVTPKGMKHTVSALEDNTIIQITVEGPWGVEYVEKANDARATSTSTTPAPTTTK